MGDWTKIEQMVCRMAVKHRVLVKVYTLEAAVEQEAGEVAVESMVIDEREEEVVTALQVQHEHSGQWVDFERCVKHKVSTISVQAVRAIGIKTLPIGGTAVLWVRAPTVEGGEKQLASFEVVEEDTPSIRWAGAANWEVLPLRMPVGKELSSFAGELDSMEMASEEWEDSWWSKQLQEVQQRGLQPEGEADPDFGGILEGAEHRPEEEVLGSWVRSKVMPEGHEGDYAKPPEGNPQWMKDIGSVFVPGKMHEPGMEARWKAYGATSEVLKWVREGGYTIRVDESGRGIFKRNGKNARQNNEALVVLVLELLMKSTPIVTVVVSQSTTSISTAPHTRICRWPTVQHFRSVTISASLTNAPSPPRNSKASGLICGSIEPIKRC